MGCITGRSFVLQVFCLGNFPVCRYCSGYHHSSHCFLFGHLECAGDYNCIAAGMGILFFFIAHLNSPNKHPEQFGNQPDHLDVSMVFSMKYLICCSPMSISLILVVMDASSCFGAVCSCSWSPAMVSYHSGVICQQTLFSQRHRMILSRSLIIDLFSVLCCVLFYATIRK